MVLKDAFREIEITEEFFYYEERSAAGDLSHSLFLTSDQVPPKMWKFFLELADRGEEMIAELSVSAQPLLKKTTVH